MPCRITGKTLEMNLEGCEVDEVFEAKCFDKHGLYIPEESIHYNLINKKLSVYFPDYDWGEDTVDILIRFSSKVHQRNVKLEEIGI